VRGRSDRPRARGTSDRRRDRFREGGGTAKAELRKARAGGRNCVRMLTGAKSVVIGVDCCGHVGGAKFAGEDGLAFEICLSALAGVVADRPVHFMEKAFIVAPLAKRLPR